MIKQRVYKLGGLNLRISPFLLKDGDMIRQVNVENDMYGAKKKRPGYATYLSSIGGTVTSLFNWTQNDGTTFWNYAVSGGTLYYSTQGTGAWTVCGNGTLTNGARPGHAVLENTLILGDGTAATRHTTDGTSFTNTSSAPIANYFDDYQNRIFAGGTSSSLFWSTTGTPTSWTGADSTSVNIPGPGKINSVFKVANRLISTKNSGKIFRWDGFELYDTATDLGPTFHYSVGHIEDYRFYPNRLGVYGFGGVKPEIISNPIERQIYNDVGEGIVGGTFDLAPGIVHRYDYLWAVGAVTDDLTDETINNLILKYDYQLDEWGNWDFARLPTAFGTYVDTSGNSQLIFGDNTGQCYTYGGTTSSDNGSSIQCVMEFIIHDNAPETEKKRNYLWLFSNPGNEAHAQIALADSFTHKNLVWEDIGQLTDGFTEYRFPDGSRSRLLFLKITEASRNSRFHFYGWSQDFDPIERR